MRPLTPSSSVVAAVFGLGIDRLLLVALRAMMRGERQPAKAPAAEPEAVPTG